MGLYSRHWKGEEHSHWLLTIVLRAADCSRRPLEWAGVDHPVFRELLRTKFLLELRGSPFGGGATGSGVGFAFMLFLFAAIGFAVGLTALMRQSAFDFELVSQGASMGLFCFILVTQYMSILVDPTDIAVVAPHPVPDRTLFAARLAHIVLYLALHGVAFHLGAMLIPCFVFPPLAVLLVHPPIAVLSTALTLGAVGLLFALVLRILGPVRFQRMTLWLQVVIATLWIGGMQVLPRIPAIRDAAAYVQHREELWALLPPVHYAWMFEAALGNSAGEHWVAIAVAILMPIALLWLTLRLAARHFIAGLSGELELAQGPLRGWRPSPLSRLGRVATRTSEERAGFDFAVALAQREPNFVRRAWPQLIAYQAMGFAMVWNASHGLDFPESVVIPLVMGLQILGLPTLLELAQYGKSPDARWIFLAKPVGRPRLFLCGAVKGLFAGTELPLGLLMVLALFLFLGPSSFAPIVLAAEMMTVALFESVRHLQLFVPFTRPQRVGEMNFRNCGTIVGLLAALVALSGAHWLVCRSPVVLWIAIAGFAPLVRWEYRALERLRMPTLEPT